MNDRTITLLLIDDSEEDREIFKRYLKKDKGQHFNILENESGELGLAQCLEQRPDCVLLDYHIPDLDGLEFIDLVRQKGTQPHLPILMLSGQGDEDVAAEALKRGATDYLVKGKLTSEGLLRAIARALEKAALLRRMDHQHVEIERSRKELEQFAFTASHDLQAPIRRIIKFLELLRLDLQDTLEGRAADYLNRAEKSALHMRRFIQNLLEYAQVGGANKQIERVHLNLIIKDVLTQLEVPIQESQASLHIEDLPTVSGIPTLLQQVFQNLITNAIKFRSDRPLLIDITCTLQERFWLFSVSDNGVGIASDSLETIFGLFHRGQAQTSIDGTGIGLSVCQKIIHLHGGQMWVESSEHVGSTFFFTLPGTPPAQHHFSSATDHLLASVK